MVRNLGFFEKKKTQSLKREKVDRESMRVTVLRVCFFDLFSLFLSLSPLLLFSPIFVLLY